MPDLEDGTETTTQPADDIRSQLTAALEQSENAGNDDAATSGKTTTTPDDGADTGQSARVRDPATGKFVKKDDAAEDPAATTTTAAKAAEPKKDDATAQATTTQAAAADAKEPPAHWSQADKDKFKAQAPEVQSFLLDRFKSMEADYTRKTQAVAHLQKEYGPVNDMFAPHMDAMRAKGFTPRSLIEAWANVETKLAQGPDSAVDVIKGLVGGYNIPVAKIAAALGISATQNPGQQTTQNPGQQQQPTAVENGQIVALPPEVAAELKALREQVGSFGQKFQTIEQREQAARQAQEIAQANAVQSQVDQFKSAQDDKGNLLHPHFADVEDLMTLMAQGYVASKQAVPELQALYEMAVHASPTVREKVLTAQRQQEEAKRTEEAKAKAAAARRAGSSVTGAPGSGQAPQGKTNAEQSIRDSLVAAFDEVDA